LYGGSVNLENASCLFEQKNIDGALIGGSSLDGKEFALIANVFNDLRV
jgi:triosephosphate isomerase